MRAVRKKAARRKRTRKREKPRWVVEKGCEREVVYGFFLSAWDSSGFVTLKTTLHINDVLLSHRHEIIHWPARLLTGPFIFTKVFKSKSDLTKFEIYINSPTGIRYVRITKTEV